MSPAVVVAVVLGPLNVVVVVAVVPQAVGSEHVAPVAVSDAAAVAVGSVAGVADSAVGAAPVVAAALVPVALVAASDVA